MPGESSSVSSSKIGSQKKLIITSAYIIGGMSLLAMIFNLGNYECHYSLWFLTWVIITQLNIIMFIALF